VTAPNRPEPATASRSRHGGSRAVDPAVFFGDDPDLALVNADPHTWMEAHPCDCEALCVCDAESATERQ
jgi:hypothetical protein